MEKTLPIHAWLGIDKPREKLMQQGRKSLSSIELLAILIGHGHQNNSAVDIAMSIMKKAQNHLPNIYRWEVDDFCKIKGMGKAKAVSIIAALELASRKNHFDDQPKLRITCSDDAYHCMRHLLEDLNHEEFWIVTLNQKNNVISQHKISEGGITATVVDQRKLFKKAIDDKCTGILLFHNHPSGNKQASEQDLQLTKTLQAGGKLLDISILDHIIVAQNGYCSFADEGLL